MPEPAWGTGGRDETRHPTEIKASEYFKQADLDTAIWLVLSNDVLKEHLLLTDEEIGILANRVGCEMASWMGNH